MSAWNGARAGWAGSGALSLYGTALWDHDDYGVRLSDYSLFEGYFGNTVYGDIRLLSEAVRQNQRLYRYIAGIFNPIKRENDLYSANVYQGSLDAEDLGAGALPLAYENRALEVPLQQVMKWSNLGQHLSRYTSEAALYGDAAWWIVDDRLRRRVRMELLHPSKIRDVDRDEVGNVRACVIEYEKAEAPDIERYQPKRFGTSTAQQGKTYVYTLKVTKRDEATVHFETFKDGEPWGFADDGTGSFPAEWDEFYPFVPLKLAAFEPAEDGWGRNSFYASRSKLDQVNSVASQLNASVRRVIEPLLLAKNVTTTVDSTGKRKIDLGTQKDDATGVGILFVSGTPQQEADVQPLTIPLDLAAALNHVQAMLLEIERDMPVLALQRIREGSALTAPGVRSGYSDAIGRIESARKNLDPPLVAALQMAVTIGAVQGYDGFQGFSADSYDNGDMELRVKERAVMPDELTTQERLNAYGTVKDLPPGLLRRALMDMNIPRMEIDAILAEAQAEQKRKAEAAERIAATGAQPNAAGGAEAQDEAVAEQESEAV